MTRRFRRWLVIFLVVVLPLQSLWAAAATMCMHEGDARSGHFGHHEHRHSAVQPDSGESPGKSHLPGTDLDCSLCHPGGAQIVSTDAVVALPIGSPDWVTAPDPPAKAIVPTDIERPQWSRLA